MYAIRICGTNDYVSKIDPKFAGCCPPGKVEYVPAHRDYWFKKYPTQLGAERAAKLVAKIDGVHCDVENLG